jgi:hypothetical protein
LRPTATRFLPFGNQKPFFVAKSRFQVRCPVKPATSFRHSPENTAHQVIQSFIFSPKTGIRIARHAVYWLSWLTLLSLIYGTRAAMYDPVCWWGINRNYIILLGQYLPTVCSMALSTYVLLYGIIPRFYPQKAWRALAGSALLLLAFAIVSEILIDLYWVNPLRLHFGMAITEGHLIYFFAIMNLFKHGSGMAGTAAAIRMFKQWWQEQAINQALRQQQLESELQLLRMQLHPHFLFNTLNNLYGLIGEHANQQAADVVERLSHLLRYMLYECDAPRVPLEREIRHLRDYLVLEKVRCDDRLDLAVAVRGDTHGKYIAPLLLLPFLENSFKHGVAHAIEQAWINLDIDMDDKGLHFCLSNSKNSPHTHPVFGIGLENVRRRLNLLYPEKHQLHVAETDDSYTVNLYIELTYGDNPKF